MIYNQNMAQQYNRNKILTATPAELTLLLYEGAIKFCNIAQVAIEKNDTASCGASRSHHVVWTALVALAPSYC